MTRPEPGSGPTLQRRLSLPLITLYGLGNILGAGIYVLLGKIVGHAGGYAPLSFLLAAGLACLTAFTYAELSARFPVSAGEAVYVAEGLRADWPAKLVGVLIMLAASVASATILRGFAGYLQVFIDLPTGVILPVVVLLLGGLAAWGIAESVAAAAAVTLLEIVGLLLVIGVGLPGLDSALPDLAAIDGWPGIDHWPGILIGAFLAFFAILGFEDMVNVAEEVRDPTRNLPRAIFAALLLATLLYFAVAAVAIARLPAAQLAASEAPLALLYQEVTGREPVAITLIAALAVINGALIQIIMLSRLLYGMARRRWLPRALQQVSARTRTPLVATAVVALLVLGLALSATTETLARATSFFLLGVFTLTNLALWRLKARGDQPPGVIDVPAWVPASGFVASLAFMLAPLVIGLLD